MKNKIVYGLITVLTFLSAHSFADHNSPSGSVALLLAEAEELEEVVRHSGLRYDVQSTVYRFLSGVQRLTECQRRGPRPIFNDHAEIPGVSGSCTSELFQVRSAFRQVGRYLWDTMYDFPQVSQVYLKTKRALDALVISGGPGPGPSLSSCVAVDNGWEEHFGGHLGYGRTPFEAQRSALMECQRLHGSCRIQSCR